MIYLIDRHSRKVIEKNKGDYEAFINEIWGGWHPFIRGGEIQTMTDECQGCEDYTKVWSPRPTLPKDV